MNICRNFASAISTFVIFNSNFSMFTSILSNQILKRNPQTQFPDIPSQVPIFIHNCLLPHEIREIGCKCYMEKVTSALHHAFTAPGFLILAPAGGGGDSFNDGHLTVTKAKRIPDIVDSVVAVAESGRLRPSAAAS